MRRAFFRPVSGEDERKGPKLLRRSDRVGVVIPSTALRQGMVAMLAGLGHQTHGVSSLSEALDLVESHDIDTLVLDVSAFSTDVLSQFGRAIGNRRSISFIASVSVVSVVDSDQDHRSEAPWRHGTYWLSYSGSGLSDFSFALTGLRAN